MWGSLLGLSLLVAVNPVALAIVLVIISRSRPIQNLLVFWVGALLVNLTVFLVPLALLHMNGGFASFTQEWAPRNSRGSLHPVPLALGVILLSIVAMMVARHPARQHANLPAGVADSPTLTNSNPGPSDSGPLSHVKHLAVKAVEGIRRLAERMFDYLENGPLWVVFIIGMMYLPSLTLVVLIETTIVTSGAGLGEQIAAAIAFVVGMLAILEIVLFSSWVAPTKTQAILRPLHVWAQAHNRKILILFFALIGLWQLSRGLGLV